MTIDDAAAKMDGPPDVTETNDDEGRELSGARRGAQRRVGPALKSRAGPGAVGALKCATPVLGGYDGRQGGGGGVEGGGGSSGQSTGVVSFEFVFDSVSSQIQLCTIKPAAMAILSRKENTSKHVRLPFTKTEEAALRKGVELHGTGSWAVILGSGHLATQRTNIDLKDKWRNLMARTVADGAVGHSYAAEEKRLARLDRKRPARDVLSAPEHRATRSAKRSPVDEPQLVGLRPYLNDIHRLYLETEGLKHATSSYINAKMRAILIDWLVEVHLKFKLMPETLYLTVNLIDRFLEKEQVMRNKLQLVGVTAMFIACKYEEVFPPACSDFVYVSDKMYTRDEILRMEGQMLSALNFELTVPSPLVFVRRFVKVAGVATTPRSATDQLAHYLVELTLQEEHMLRYLPSTICAAALSLALKTRDQPGWSPALEQHSTYAEADLQACVRALHELHRKAAANSLQAVHNKYAHEARHNVSGIAPVCPRQLELATRVEPPAVLRENPYRAYNPYTRQGPKSASRRWAGAIVVD